MKTTSANFVWIEEIENLVKSPKFCETISACQGLLEEVNSLIPTDRMKFLKLNLSLAVESLTFCQKQVFRLVYRLRRLK